MKIKKLSATLLAAVMLLSCFVISPVAGAEEPNIPTVYVCGMNQSIYSADGKALYENGHVPTPDGYFGDAVKKCMPDFINAVLFGRWEKYHQSFMEIWEPVYREIRLDKNGEVTNGSYITFDAETVPLKLNGDGAYSFYNDWRIDPFATAEKLNIFIQRVKAETGAKKVNIISRCEGCNILMAYLAEYGYDDVNCLEFYASAANGVDAVGAAFSGDFELYPKELQAFYYASRISLGDENITLVINSALDWLVETYGFERACELLKTIVPALYENVLYDILLSSYGSFPGIWACVGPDYYAKARKIVFDGREEEYKGLIEKIDRYDREVRQRNNELLLKAKAAGVKVAVIAKYGEYIYKAPVCRECLDVSDDAISIPNASFGATVSDTKYEQFSERYLSRANMKYISPCKRIDASTCLFPDTAWFVYGCDHDNFPAAIDSLLKKFFATDGTMTVDTYPDYPQYMTYANGKLKPMTADDVTIDLKEQQDSGFIARLFRAIKKFFELIKVSFEVMFGVK